MNQERQTTTNQPIVMQWLTSLTNTRVKFEYLLKAKESRNELGQQLIMMGYPLEALVGAAEASGAIFLAAAIAILFAESYHLSF